MPAVNADPLRLLGGIHCFLLDMDGTFYVGDTLIEGSLEFLQRLSSLGRRFLFLTNNSSRTQADYVRKLAALGVSVSPDEVATSGQATVAYLRAHERGKRVYLLGTEALRDEFRQEGIVLDDRTPELVVTAFDTSLDYAKLCRVCELVRMGLPFVATHPDLNCPTPTGFIPDIGAIHAFIEASTGRRPDVIVGKPHRPIVDYARSLADASPGQTAMVGDRLYTDVAMGRAHGLTSILVLSGETALCDLDETEIQPDLVFSSLGHMIPWL